MHDNSHNFSRRTVLAATALGLSGCAASSDSGSDSSGSTSTSSSSASSGNTSDTSTLYINHCSEPDTLDPGLISTTECSMLSAQSFIGLYSYDENGDIVPCIAEGDPDISDDGLTYTIHLKETQWSDGSDLTANDFVYSWNRVVADETAADFAYLFDLVTRNDDGTLAVTADDDYTLTVNFDYPCPYFLELLVLDTFYPVPQDEVEAANPDGDSPGAWCMEAGYKCNGAFTLESWSHDESMTYAKNEYFYDADNVSLEKLEYMLSTDETATFAAYQSGDLDFIDNIPTDEIDAHIDDDDFHIIPSSGTYYLNFNVNSDFFEGMTREEACDFRKAICLLINRQYMVDTAAKCDQQIADSFICAGLSDGNGGIFKTDDVSYYDASEEALADNQAEAKELLEGLGYTFTDNGDGTYECEPNITIPYIYDDGSRHQLIAECFQQDLAVLGIDVTLEVQEENVYIENRRNGNFVLAREAWLTDYNDPIDFIEMFTSDSGNNDAQLGKEPKEDWSPEWDAYDELVDEIRTCVDLEERVELCHDAEDMLMATWAIIPIYYYNDIYMQKTNVDGIFAKFNADKYFYYATKE